MHPLIQWAVIMLWLAVLALVLVALLRAGAVID